MATALMAGNPSSSTAAPMQVFALGWQKSGSTIMTTLLGHGLNVSYITEAVETCWGPVPGSWALVYRGGGMQVHIYRC